MEDRRTSIRSYVRVLLEGYLKRGGSRFTREELMAEILRREDLDRKKEDRDRYPDLSHS